MSLQESPPPAAVVRDRVRVAVLTEGLRRRRNPDGGWGYYPGKTSRLEPTCWALLALGDGALDHDVLRRWPAENGLLLERRGGTPNFAFHAQALLTLHALQVEHAAGNASLVAGIQRVGGRALPPSKINRQDNSLVAWSWIPETFSWVEPTAWCLLALKQWEGAPGVSVDRRRTESAERMLIDRVCVEGGWNYGNSNMLGADLKPFVATSAVGVMAMQDKQDAGEVARSIAYLERAAPKELSGMSLALASLALRAVGRPVEAVREVVLRQLDTSLALENQLAIAASLYALKEQGRHAFIL